MAEITDFGPDGTLDGISYANGALKVLQSGTYYIYAQAFFEALPPGQGHRLALIVSGQTVSLLQNPPGQGSMYGNRFTGVIKELNPGDIICLKALSRSKLWMEKAHTFFGAMKISV